MKHIYLLLAITMYNCIFACVTFNPSTGTYTVDPSGCVYEPKIDIYEYIEDKCN